MSTCDSRGFTLVEVLIATLILTMLVYLATLSYSLFLRVWSERRFSDVNAIDDYRSQALLRSALESIYDYYVLASSTERASNYCAYFKGTGDAVAFVTLSSVFHRGYPAAARLGLQKQSPSSDNELRSLVYEEAPLDLTYVKHLGDEPKYTHNMTICPKVRSVNLRYLAEAPVAPTADQSSSEIAPEIAIEWRNSFTAQGRNSLPSLIELTIAREQGDLILLFPVRAHNPFKADFFGPQTF